MTRLASNMPSMLTANVTSILRTGDLPKTRARVVPIKQARSTLKAVVKPVCMLDHSTTSGAATSTMGKSFFSPAREEALTECTSCKKTERNTKENTCGLTRVWKLALNMPRITAIRASKKGASLLTATLKGSERKAVTIQVAVNISKGKSPPGTVTR